MSELEHLDIHASYEEQIAFLKRQAHRDRMAQINLEEETEDMRYMTECEKYGYTYGCDSECPVLMRGECKHAEEMGVTS